MNVSQLSKAPLFEGISEDDLLHLLPCLRAREQVFQKDDILFHAGHTVTEIGLLEGGSVNIVVNFYWGDSHIFGHVGPGDIFGQNFAALDGRELNCDIVAAEDARVLFIQMRPLLVSCRNACAYHHRLIENLVRISALKNLSLSRRMLHIAPKSIRGRVLSYLSELATENSSAHVTIPFSRQQLAEYLAVDRSALSNELSKMQRDGLIAFHRNDFTLSTDFERFEGFIR